MKQGKIRLDAALVERGLCQTRTNAQALIMAGEVRVNGQSVLKASHQVKPEDILSLKEKLKYVSRGGLKLEKALRVFPIDVQGAVCVDVGASTGGFTDCLLQNGAKHVYAVDVGHGQMAYSLRNDERVTCMEKYNARYMQVEDIEAVDFACTDVSFISLELILPPIYRCMKDGAQAVALIKPQFEAGREQIGKAAWYETLRSMSKYAAKFFRLRRTSDFPLRAWKNLQSWGQRAIGSSCFICKKAESCFRPAHCKRWP